MGSISRSLLRIPSFWRRPESRGWNPWTLAFFAGVTLITLGLIPRQLAAGSFILWLQKSFISLCGSRAGASFACITECVVGKHHARRRNSRLSDFANNVSPVIMPCNPVMNYVVESRINGVFDLTHVRQAVVKLFVLWWCTGDELTTHPLTLFVVSPACGKSAYRSCRQNQRNWTWQYQCSFHAQCPAQNPDHTRGPGYPDW